MIRLLLTLLGLNATAWATDSTPHAKPPKPNIIVILADDMGYSDIGCYGSEIHTPNIDRLANEGVRFTQFYNAARCCPTRAALLTGMYHHKTGMGGMTGTGIQLPAYQGYINDESMTFGEVFQLGGYRTYLSGKWHVGDAESSWPVNRGFDESFCLIGGAADYFDPYQGDYNKIKMLRNRDPYIPPDSGFYMTDAISEEAPSFIRNHLASGSQTPFLLYVAYTAPHWPLQAPAKDIERYRDTYRVGWDSLRLNRYRRMQQLGVIDQNTRLTDRDETIPAWNSLGGEEQAAWAGKMAVYAAMVNRMDQGIGKVLDVLDASGIAENTIVIFLSDNGGCMELAENFGKSRPGSAPGAPGSFISYEANWANASNTPFRYFKHWMHEGGIATPFIIRYPNAVAANSWRHAPAHIIDVVPTLMEYSGIDRPETYRGKLLKSMDGKSLVPVLEGNDRTMHDALYWEHLGFRAVRKGDWKLVSTFPDEKWELYNLKEDRSETTDLSASFPGKVAELDELYTQWAKRSEVMPWKEARKYRKRVLSAAPRGQIGVQEVMYKQVDTVRLKMKLYYPADYNPGKRYPAIVFFFGGGWMTGNIDQFKPQAEYLASKGMIAATAEYRVGKKHGTTPFESVKDGRSAIRYLRKNAEYLGIDTEKLAAGGGSAGGHVAAAADLTAIDDETDDLSVNPRPDALVLFNPVFNNGPGNYGYDRLKDRYLEISPFHNIREGAAPAVVMLGTKDKLIPVETAKQYQQKMREARSRCDLILYKGQEHGFFNYRPQQDLRYFRETLSAAEKFLTDLGYIVN